VSRDEPKYRDQREANAARARGAAAARLAAQGNASEHIDWDYAIELFKTRRRRR
jgi:hypothetical protein